MDFAPSLPTPVSRCPALGNGPAEVWCKNDGLSHTVYGGNKVRKLARLVVEAKRRGASRILTFGAAGSHHLLTTALFARAHGLRAAGLVLKQTASLHVEETLRASVAQGLEVYPVPSYVLLPFAMLHAYDRGDFVVAPGGSNAVGSLAYLEAVGELKQQIAAGALPEPDAIVVAVGSGGTCAGLLGGVLAHGLNARVVGVQVLPNRLGRAMVLRLARQTLVLAGRAPLAHELGARLELDGAYFGKGYGWPTPAGEHALMVARAELGLELDLTYTAKVFAKVIDLAEAAAPGYRRILYWHTLSAQPIEPLLATASPVASLPTSVRELLG
jgi:D-cysteine desulfhydrase